MADETKSVPGPTTDATKVGEVEVNNRRDSPEPPRSPRIEISQAPKSPHIEQVHNEKHFSTAPTLTTREVYDESTNSGKLSPHLPSPQAPFPPGHHPEINQVPYSPLYAPNDFRNTGTWTDAAYPKKPDYDVEAREVDPKDGIDWEPGVRSQFPYIGFAGFVTIIFATAMAVAILGLSDGKRVSDWPFKRYTTQPNVLLNIANQVQNLGLITLIGQGLAIAWWRKALRGSSLSTLHRNHAYSYSFMSIVTSGKHFNIIALAALMTKFAVIDSTLFQKATKTVITQQKAYTNATVTAWAEAKWTPNSGGIPGDEGTIKTVDAAWAGVIEAYNGKIANGKLHDLLEDKASFFNCPFRQECSGFIKSIGFAFQCQTAIENVDYGLQRQSQRGGNSSTYPLWDIKFDTEWPTANKPYANIKLQMLYVNSGAGSSEGSCPGTLTRRTCLIRPAIVNYPITVMRPSEEELRGGNIVTHVKFYNDSLPWALGEPLKTEQIDDLTVVEYNDLNEQFGKVSTVGALTYVFNNLYSSSANLTYTTGWDISSRGSQAQTIFYADNDQDDHSKCNYDINKEGRDDPAIEILRKINTLSFITALYVKGAPNMSRQDREKKKMDHQTFVTSVTGIVEQYKTSFAYVGGALAATFLTVLFVLPVYWGFWELGRKVTLAPLEISHAFNAPIIAPDKTKNHHGDFDEVLNEVGKRRVQYGQLVNAPPGQMGLAEPHKVATPDVRSNGTVMHGKSKKRIAMGAAIGGVLAATIGGNAK
ncbi:hypothetical protein GQ44DRAFT_709652 [Phaeosphaeriaceae sp. PMI808]|nr:hypothetical protein GQ44DRAFT_709652 [Phaeosphaeriaceae sp. PMI808]